MLADLPPLKGSFTDSCPYSSYFISTLRVHIWQTKCWQIYSPSNGNFTDLCSDSPYFIPFLRADIWQTSCGQIYPSPQMVISQIAALTPHISFSLWELIFGKQRCWQIYPHASNGNYRFLFYSYLADHVVAHPTPFSYGSFPDCCSNSSYFIPTLRAHIWQTNSWQIYPPGHPSNGDYRFLLLELIFGRPTVGRSTPLNGSFTDSCSDSSYFIPTLRAHIWQTRNGQIYPLPYTKQQL